MEPNQVALQGTSVTRGPKLFVSLELADKKWRVAISDGGTRVSEYTVSAGEGAALMAVIERARSRFGLGRDVKVLSCYEAGRDGFWLHRFLLAHGIVNHVVDAASIEVNRRQHERIVDKIRAAANTNKIGDGKIFVTPVERVEVRTAELGTWAGAIGAGIHAGETLPDD